MNDSQVARIFLDANTSLTYIEKKISFSDEFQSFAKTKDQQSIEETYENPIIDEFVLFHQITFKFLENELAFL